MATTAFEIENTRALSDPTLRARFSLSFSAQMMLSQESVKESCAAAALLPFLWYCLATATSMTD